MTESMQPAPPAPPKRGLSPRILSVVVLLATFGVGVLGGIVLDRHHLHREFGSRGGWRDRGRHWSFSDSEHRRRWGMMAKKLDLTPEQQAAADTIFAQRSRQLAALREGVEPDMKRIMGEARSQIDSLLTPEQRAKLAAMRKDREKGTGR